MINNKKNRSEQKHLKSCYFGWNVANVQLCLTSKTCKKKNKNKRTVKFTSKGT